MATITSQNTSTRNFVRRPVSRRAADPVLQQAVKHTLDPLNLFNPGKVVGIP